jgi:probable HAF family extracellular repeat protein
MMRTRFIVCVAALAAACAGEGPTDVTPISLGKATTTAGPTVTATSPNSAARDTTVDIHVLGSGFDRGSQVDFLLDGVSDPRVRTNSTRYVSQGDLVANVTLAIDAVPARYDVMVTTSRGKKGIGTERFEVLSLVDLGLTAGGYSYGRDVNSAGIVVGEYAVPKTTCKRAYVWTEATGPTDLPVPPGTCISLAAAINDAGTVVGWATLSAGMHAALRWTPDGEGGWSMEQLPPPSGYASGDALAVSSAGHVVGAYLRSDGNWDYFVRSPAGTWQAVQMPGAGCAADVVAVNALGQLVGGDCTSALLWPAPDAAPVRLPGPGGSAIAWDLDDAGNAIVGRVRTSSGLRRAVRWTAEAESWSLSDLGDLGGGEAEARSINSQGDVAGWSTLPSTGSTLRAFVWRSGTGMKALGTLSNQSSNALALANRTNGPLYLSGFSVGTARGSYQRAVRWTE